MEFPQTPKPRLDEFLPTQDVRLIDKNDSTFALLGLSEKGEPMIVLLDPTGSPLAGWTAAVRGRVTVDAFDEQGMLRLNVDLEPRRDPMVTLLERGDYDSAAHTSMYVLDPDTLQETELGHSPTGGRIPWLASEMGEIHQPISLLDQRGDVLWVSGR